MSPRRSHRLSRDQIVAMHQSGMSPVEIAAQLGCNPSTVRYHLAIAAAVEQEERLAEPAWCERAAERAARIVAALPSARHRAQLAQLGQRERALLARLHA